MAVVQSEPPHCTPTTSPDKGARLAFQILRGPLHLADELTASGLGFDGAALLLNEDGVHGLAAADGDLQVKRPDLLTAEPPR